MDKWSKSLRGPFRGFVTRLDPACPPQRFSVYHRQTYHDKNLVRDNATKQVMCFPDGAQIVFPDAWMRDDHPSFGTDLDPQVNLGLNAYAICESLNKNPASAANHIWGRGYSLAGYWATKLAAYVVHWVVEPALAWWIATHWLTFDFAREHPIGTAGLIWMAMSLFWTVLWMVVVIVAGKRDADQSKWPVGKPMKKASVAA